MGKLSTIGGILRGIAGAVGAANPVTSVMSAVAEILEVIVDGKGRGAVKKEIGVDVSHVLLQHLAKAGIVPAVPPKEELGQLADSVVAVKNARGWDYAPALADVIDEADDIVEIFRAGLAAGRATAAKQ
jgi:hypothetical protein